jgi:glutamate/aspartate transport system permease protein
MRAFDVSAILSTWPYLLQGLWFTIQITLVGVTGGIVFGSLLAVARMSRHRLLSAFATAYVNLMRSIPLILVIFWVFFHGAMADRMVRAQRPSGRH